MRLRAVACDAAAAVRAGAVEEAQQETVVRGGGKSLEPREESARKIFRWLRVSRGTLQR